MSLLDKLKSLLGLGSADDEPRQDIGVTVERDPGESEPESDVRADDTSAADDSVDSDEEELDETAGEAEPDTDDDTIDEGELIDEAEPAESAVETSEDESGDDAPDGEGEDADEEADAPDGEGEDADETQTDPTAELQDIKGIGPAYAERLADAGISSIADLAAADAAEIAAETDLSESRVENWIEQANVR